MVHFVNTTIFNFTIIEKERLYGWLMIDLSISKSVLLESSRVSSKESLSLKANAKALSAFKLDPVN